MGKHQQPWMSHLLSLAAIMAFGLMSLACFDIENLTPQEADVFWEPFPEPIPCDRLSQNVTTAKRIKFYITSPDQPDGLENVAIDVTFEFWISSWTEEYDEDGNMICSRSTGAGTTRSVFTDFFGATDWVSSPLWIWKDAQDIMVISWSAYKSGYSSRAGSFILYHNTSPDGITKAIRMVNLNDENPN